MEFFLLIIGLMFATVLIVGVSERIGLPYPVLMLLFALGAGFLPFMPAVHISPELILPAFLPPLLFATAQRSSWSVFRLRWQALIRLAVILIVVTAGAVAATAWAVAPVLSLPLAIALGAIVAPPDPVAVDAVAGKNKMPRRLTTLLQTEGLFNDAMAIVIFQLAVNAMLSGTQVGWQIIPQFILGAAAAVLLGIAMAGLIGVLNRLVPNLVARCAASFVAPYAVYLIAEQIHASGVIAVVVTALELVRRDRPENAQERLTHNAFWQVLELLATGLAFGFMGVEMNKVVIEEGANLLTFVPGVVLICVVVFAVRAAWMFATYFLPRARYNGSMAAKDALVLTWCGMRGLATLALALALPVTTAGGTPIEGRNFAVVTACTVVLLTLVLPGLGLPTLLKVLGVRVNEQLMTKQRRALANRIQHTAMKTLKASPQLDELPEEFRASVTHRLQSLHVLLQAEDPETNPVDSEKQAEYRKYIAVADALQSQALNAARDELLRARNERGIDPRMVDDIVQRLDRRTMTLDM